MAMDIRIFLNSNMKMEILWNRQLLALFQMLIILSECVGSPVWMPQFLSGGQGRSIRHLPCVSRRTGEQGVCMFAYTCLKSNGTHLGTCIDRFYFGSCCKLGEASDLLVDSHFPVMNNNQVTSSNFPPGGSTQEISVQNELNKITSSLFPSNTKLSYSTRTTQSVETSTAPMKLPTTDKTIVDLAQHLATETYFLTPSTEKYYVPVHTSKPNRTETFTSVVSLISTNASSTGQTGAILDVTRPATTTTSQPYLLSTFQVVHGGGETLTKITPTTMSAISKRPATSPPAIVELVSLWTPIKPNATPSTVVQKKNSTDSSHGPTLALTTTKKPSKPIKPYATTTTTTTRKPSTKKPTATTQKPAVVKLTTSKPLSTVKKPTSPTKKPSTSKPASIKPPSSNLVSPPQQATTHRPVTTTHKHQLKPTSSSSQSTTVRYPIFSTHVETTSEIVFTKPGSASLPSQTPGYGITTFRPDLASTTSKRDPIIAASGLTTFSYVSDSTKVTTPTLLETTTLRSHPTKPEHHSSTDKNEISSSHWTSTGSPSEIHQENTNLIFQQAETTATTGVHTSVTSFKPDQTSVPFFPDAERPGIPTTQWIEMIQTSVKPESPPATTMTSPQTSAISTLFEGLNQSDYNQVCGRRIYPQSRVVGGEKSTFGKWPWQISLRQWRTSTYLHKCGAALLNENWAITAAHCVENVPPSDLLLRLGEHDLSTEDEPFGFQERRVQIVASHPQFDPRTFEYDLALLRFYEPVKFQPNIIPVCVPEDDTNFVGQTAYVTGWGRLYEDGPLPSVLQEVSVPVINNTLCENMYRSAGYIEHIPEIFICAGWKKGGFDSCEGDSGGPMVIQRADKRWLLAGVISWGIGCAEPNQPGVYTRISEFRDWIHQILQF